jgi:hypothetical protein
MPKTTKKSKLQQTTFASHDELLDYCIENLDLGSYLDYTIQVFSYFIDKIENAVLHKDYNEYTKDSFQDLLQYFEFPKTPVAVQDYQIKELFDGFTDADKTTFRFFLNEFNESSDEDMEQLDKQDLSTYFPEMLERVEPMHKWLRFRLGYNAKYNSK